MTGPDFFAALVCHIAAALNASHAFVAELVEGGQLRSLAAWGDGQHLPNNQIDIDGTTCAITLRQGVYHCQRDVIARFPRNPMLAVMDVESYMGVALKNRQGDVLGTLCVFARQPLADPDHSQQILRVFAARATAELERQRAEMVIGQQFAAITHNALHDPLTGLPNRTLLLERLELAIHRAQRCDSYRYAVLFLDLDRFKVINDSLGHVVGDQLLMAIAQRLKTHLRQTDLVARLGGDEFLILLEDISSTGEVTQIAERILADSQTPLLLNGHPIFASISMGIVLSNKDYQQATDVIRDADIAMYEAKSRVPNSYRFFDVAMHIEALTRLTLETDLRKALEQHELTVHYQPIIELSNCQLMGFEALVRWQHPTQDLITPDEFIPIAEETGLIQGVDSWVIYQACQQLANWQKQFSSFSSLKVSVNLSAQDLCKPNLIQEIDEILSDTGLSGNSVILEITESLLIKDVEQIINLLTQLTTRQIRISIDDFGTGYSSLSYLHRLPAHSLKIDRSFVSQMEVETRNHDVVSTIISLGQQLELDAIAEGIETPQQLQLLRQLGCQFGQGYLFSPPLSAQNIEVLLQGYDSHGCS